MAQHFYLTYDEKCTNIYYPFVKGAAAFWDNYLRFEDGSPEQYYPEETDWSRSRYACFCGMDALVDVLGYDSGYPFVTMASRQAGTVDKK
ncbi:MAG: hypothetical protein HN352_09730 [Bacteroidetes bacterium]|jgi:hypothetical protein|nr:hypothetical protein [Bacteroidota bacterium]MBT3751227.1 hypothetical protein [Bacteroidota bacterium]MBT4397926.1 hypothetical protein [Bacteroidota bacterium]MBT4412438.1 hypothetical protein [Bacteroidota bacterium]MBT5427883.1 hypothetical protein [Bacteroidota bacterium]